MRAEPASQFKVPTRADHGQVNVEVRAEDLLLCATIGLVKSGFDELTLRQLAILFIIRDGTNSVSGVSQELGISMSSTSRSCSMLTQRGFCRGEFRGKRKILSLSPKGEAMVGKAVSTIATKL